MDSFTFNNVFKAYRMNEIICQYGIVPAEIREFIEAGKTHKVKAHKLLFSQDTICNSWIYVKKGIARQFIITPDGQSITKSFVKSDEFVLYSATSFITQKVADTSFETLTDCEIIEFKDVMLEEHLGKQRYKEYLNCVLMDIILHKEERENEFLKDAATIRVAQFSELHGELFNRIPHYYIASYLGITPETLSRIRSAGNFGKQKIVQRMHETV